jgi:hypothetical protein
MKFEFAKYTEITELYKKHGNLQEGDGYIRFFICLDTNDFWLIRVIEGVNEEYEREEGVYLLERNNIRKESKGQDLSLSKVIELIKADEFDNWDIKEYSDLDELIEDIDGGYGLN